MPEAIEISQLNDPLPTCPRCRSPVIFTGNEKPDLKWTFNWRHHFLCTVIYTKETQKDLKKDSKARR
jgi:hypothetical protein